MKLQPKLTIFDHFCEMDDPRVERTKQQKLIDIITIAQRAIAVDASSLRRDPRRDWLAYGGASPYGDPTPVTWARETRQRVLAPPQGTGVGNPPA